jgi:tetratricopeptide (TPR) repeat protein
MVGDHAEDMVHLFCIIDRQSVVVNTLLKHGFIPTEGLSVPHLRNREESVFLSAETLRGLLVFTMADISDQYFGWQDRLFGGDEMINSMLVPGQDNLESHDSYAIWPGESQPGLWMSYVSQLGAVARTLKPPANEAECLQGGRVYSLPPIFDNCSKLLLRDDEAKARDLYWSVMTGQIRDAEHIIATLKEAIIYNPWAFEPYVILAQKYLHRNDFDLAKEVSQRALNLQMQWGTAWDKRLSFAAWVAWTRVLFQRAEDRLDWPRDSWHVNNFGLVR